MKILLEKLAKLIDVKSLVTLSFTILIIILACKKLITGEQVMMTYSTIIAFYFGTQSTKKSGDDKDEKD